MTVEQKNEATLVSKEAFHAIGLKWEGTFAEAGAGSIKAVHQEFQERLKEIPHVIHPETMLGLSYHAVSGSEGFTHYAVVEVEKVEVVPPGMESVSVPTLTYAACEHHTHQSIDQSYNNIYRWIKEQGYKDYAPSNLTHFEKYPMSQDPYTENPEFVIMIPVENK
ncbi:GyrI-like domain-containing protein [Ornithinibacillus salinisoli]|uniref:GyrI-like domain-containing protein n=1 Tax=Ornithinibacillus salinisoli TaxID=1848459 RepID=A0ABW4VZI6_9BACI